MRNVSKLKRFTTYMAKTLINVHASNLWLTLKLDIKIVIIQA